MQRGRRCRDVSFAGGGEGVSEDEAFLATVPADPGDESKRLVYADWLEDRGDPRSSYLRAEAVWAANRFAKDQARLRKQAKGLDPVWVLRVSRPPLGVCCDNVRFENINDRERPRLSLADLEWLEIRFKLRLPIDYRAFLLNYNGGHPEPMYFRHELIQHRFGITLPTGYYGHCPDRDPKGSDNGPMYGLVSSFTTVWAAADSVPSNVQASGDWSPDLVNNLQLLEHWRSGVADWPAPYWRERVRRDLIWIGHDAPTGGTNCTAWASGARRPDACTMSPRT